MNTKQEMQNWKQPNIKNWKFKVEPHTIITISRQIGEFQREIAQEHL